MGVALQALDAREAPAEEGLRLSLLARLARHPRWVAGLLIGGLGFPLEALAFAEAPFVVVQPALAAGLLLLLALGVRLLGERVGRAEVLGVVTIIGGMTLLAWGAPEHVEAHQGTAALVTVVGGLTALTFIPFALRDRRADTALLVIVGSAVGFGAGNVATKLMSDDIAGDHLVTAGIWLAITVVTGAAAILSEMTALQRRPATTVVPISFAVQTFIPILLEPLFLRERWSTAELGGAPLLAGLLLVLVGVVTVARTRAVTLLAGGGRVERPAVP